MRADGTRGAGNRLLLVFFFLFFVVLVDQIAVFFLFSVIFVVVFFVIIVVVAVFRDDVEVNRVDLRNFHFDLAFWAAEDFAFLDFVLVNVDFSGTFGAANHGNILRKIVGPMHAGERTSMSSVLYTGCVKSTAMRGEGADR